MKAKDLKNSILQMAVQGKLVPQDPSDEPASVLLERIRTERAQLIKEKKIKAPKGGESMIYLGSDGSRYEKRSKGEPVCIDDEIPFDIPEGWEWARLGNIVYQRAQLKPTSAFSYIDIGSIDNAHQRLSSKETLIEADKAPSRARKPVKLGDVLYSTVRPYLHNMCIVDRKFSLPPIASTGFAAMVCLDGISNGYLLNYLMSPDFDTYANRTDNSKGVAYPAINDKHLYAALVPVPPLAEQRRIAERVSELMPLVGEYGKLEDEREALDASLPERLRKSVLQMAVEGKLVPQDPSEEPASVLLDRIREERAHLIKEKKIKAPKGGESVIYLGSDGRRYEKRVDAKGRESEPICIDGEIPFEIPEGWEWARLEGITTYIQRGKSPKYSLEKKYPVVAQKCNQWSGFSLERAKFVDPNSVASYAEERLLVDGDLLWNSTGLGTLGRMAVYDSNQNPYGWAVADSHVTVIRTVPDWLRYEYAFLYFAGPSVQSVIEDQASGSTKQKELAQETVKRYLIPVPPLAEQRRIAERVSELMPLVGEYGKLEDEREALDASLPERLRKSVLQMAVEGKLVPQDPSEEPASVLLDRIREERAHLIKEKKIKAPKGGESVIYLGSDGRRYEKRGKGEPVCIDDEVPFEIPEGWEWARLGSLLSVISDGTHKTPEYTNDGVLFLSVQNISKGFFDLSRVKHISRETHKGLCKRVRPQNGDILLCRIGTLGKPIIVDVDYEFSIFVSLGLLRPINRSLAEWIVNCLDSPMGFNWIQEVKVGGGTHTFKINLGDIPSFLVPIPPLVEQRRIAERISELDVLITNQ